MNRRGGLTACRHVEEDRVSIPIRIVAVSVALSLVVIAAGCGGGDAVAKVNGERITRAEYDGIVDVVKKQDMTFASLKEDDPQFLQYKRMILDSMIEAVLVRQEAKKQGAKITDKEIDAKLAEIKAGYPDEKTFNETVQKSGMTIEQIRRSIADQLAYQFLYDKVAPASEVTTEQAKEYYEKNKSTQFTQEAQAHLYHILFKPEDKATAEKVLAEIKAGADFQALAKKYSEDPGSKDQGGDLGMGPTSGYVTEFKEAADKLKVGAVSGLVKSQFGWHIIKKTDEKPAGIQPFEKVVDLIKATLQQEQRQKAWADFLEKLKASAKIEILDATLAKVDVSGSGASPD